MLCILALQLVIIVLVLITNASKVSQKEHKAYANIALSCINKGIAHDKLTLFLVKYITMGQCILIIALPIKSSTAQR